MIKKFIAGASLLFSGVVFSQQNNASPYSYYGIGDTKFKGTVDTRSMGGLGIYPDSIHVNLQNPATYSALRLTNFTVGATNARTSFKTDEATSNANRTTLDYVALALPLNKFGVSVGLMPYTAVGYRIENTTGADPVDGLERFNRFEGSGGVNRVYGGLAYQLTSSFSVGADFQYNFGNIQTKSITGVPNASVQYVTRETNDSEYSGVSFNLGALYKTRFKEKYDWVTSVTFSPQYTLNGATDRKIAAISLTANNAEVVVDEVEVNAVDADINMPVNLSVGTGFGRAQKWFAGVEYSYKGEGSLNARFDNVTNAGYETGHKVVLGGFYIPNYISYTSYLSRITYRAGLRYEKTGLVVNNESINDYALSLGIGLPLGGVGGSNLNIGAEFGKRGTKNAGLVAENYVNLFVSLSINDKWFVKRRYD